MNHPYLIYDIETYKSDDAENYWIAKKITPDSRLKDPEKIEADIAKKMAAGLEKSALSPITGRVTCVGVSHNGNFRFFINHDEKAVLEDLNTFVAGIEVADYVGKNNWDFDIPFLRVRHLANKMELPPWLRPEVRHKDIKNYFGRGMGQRGPSLADLEYVMNIRRDGEKDGLMALSWWEHEEWDLLEHYNEQDVRSTEAIYLAMEGKFL
jgi:uncharacterized protein YprB with RNaseH-like and TPR domain